MGNGFENYLVLVTVVGALVALTLIDLVRLKMGLNMVIVHKKSDK